jgi:hypothetical protein
MKIRISLLIIHFVLTVMMIAHISKEADRIEEVTDAYLNQIWINGCHFGVITNKCE